MCLSSWVCNPPIHVSRCIAQAHTSNEIPQPFIQASAQNACAGLGSYLQIRAAAAASSWRCCCTLSRPRHREERVRPAHSSSSSSRAGGTFGQLLLWLVARWTRDPSAVTTVNTALRRQQRQYCQYYPSVPECFHQPAFEFDSCAENSKIIRSRRQGKCGVVVG